MNERLGECLSVVAFLESFPFEEDLKKVGCYILGDLASSMTIKDTEESELVIFREGVIGYIGVLHVLAPSLHLTDCIF